MRIFFRKSYLAKVNATKKSLTKIFKINRRRKNFGTVKIGRVGKNVLTLIIIKLRNLTDPLINLKFEGKKL